MSGQGEVERLVAEGQRKDERMEFMQHEIDALKSGEQTIGQGQFFSSQDYQELVAALQLASSRVQELEANEATRDGAARRDADQVKALEKELASQKAASQEQIATIGKLQGENMDLRNGLDAHQSEVEQLRAQAAAPQPVSSGFLIDQNDHDTLVSTLEAAQAEAAHLATINRQLEAQLSASNVCLCVCVFVCSRVHVLPSPQPPTPQPPASPPPHSTRALEHTRTVANPRRTIRTLGARVQAWRPQPSRVWMPCLLPALNMQTLCPCPYPRAPRLPGWPG